jgi:hypothetical protein
MFVLKTLIDKYQLPGYIPDIKILLNRNVNEGVSWNLPAISISFVRD